MLLRGWLAACALWAGACALPPPARENQNFIPDEELLTVSLVQEGLFYFSRSRYFDAEVRFRQALEIFPGAENMSSNLAVVLEYQGQFDESEAIYRELLPRRPDDTRILAGLARLYNRSRRFKEAADYYQRALNVAIELEDWERAAQFARSLAALKFKIGDEGAALCYSHEALQLRRSEDEVARHTRLLVAAGYYGKARAELAGYTEDRTAGVSGTLLHSAALAYYGLGDLEGAARLEGLALDKGSALGLESEMRLVRFAAAGFKEVLADNRELEDDKPSPAEAAEDPVEAFFAGGAYLRGVMLYWPPNLIESVLTYAKERGFYDEGLGAVKKEGSWWADIFGG